MTEETVWMDFDEFKNHVIPPPQKRESLVKKIVEYTIDGVFVRAYDNAKEASIATGISSSYILNICLGKKYLRTSPFTGNKIFLFRGDDIAERLKAIKAQDEERKKKSQHASTSIEVCEYTLNGKFLFKWPNIKTVSNTYHITHDRVKGICEGKYLFHDKRIFLYPDGNIKQRVAEVKEELYRLSQKRPKYREVDEYTLEGKYVKSYICASAASRELGIHVSCITRCCNGFDKHRGNCYTANGRIFLWVGNSISDRLEIIKQSRK